MANLFPFQRSAGPEPLHAVNLAYSTSLWHPEPSFVSSSSTFPSRNDASIHSARPTTPSSGPSSVSSSPTSSPGAIAAVVRAHSANPHFPAWRIDQDGDIIMEDGTNLVSDPAMSIPTAVKLSVAIPPLPGASSSPQPSPSKGSASSAKKLVRLRNGKAGWGRETDKK